jgi:hypothetical protein
LSPELRVDCIVPWGPEAALRATRSTVLCAAALVIAWYEVAGKGVFNDQISWLSLGVFAVMGEMAALSGFIFRGRRAIGERRAALITDDVAALFGASVDEPHAAHVVVVPGSRLFHDPVCPMTVGRVAERLAFSKTVPARLEACGICHGGLPS